MNLAICSVGEVFGGVERQILDLCRFWRQEGLGSPLVVLFHDRKLAGFLRRMDIEPIIIQGRNRYDLGMVNRLSSVLADGAVDVVHVHGYKATIACGMAKRRTPFRLIKTEHGKVEATLANPLAWAKSRLNFRIEQGLTRRMVDHVCYVTDDIAGFFDGPHRGMERTTVHNGIEPLVRDAYARPDDLPATGLNVGIVGRVSPVKGIDFALEALTRPQVPPDLNLVIIGDGPSVAALQQRVAELGVGPRVHWLGFRQNIYDYLAHIDALLMPSLHEGLPYTLLEAMSLGRPVIASRVGGLAEVLQDGETGLLVDVGDIDGIADKLQSLTGESVRAMGDKARRIQAEKYTLTAMGRNYLRLYGYGV